MNDDGAGIEGDPQEVSTDEVLASAAEAIEAGDWGRATALASAAYAAGDRSEQGLELLGTCRSRTGDHEGAAAAFGELVELLTPPFAAALAALANEKGALGALDQALTALQRASALMPEDGSLAHQLANALHAQGQLGPARVHYERAARLLPGSPRVANDLGAVHAAQREYSLALERFEAAGAGRPGHPGQSFNAAQALFSLGEADRAFALFRTAEREGYGPDALTMQAVMVPGCHEVTEPGLLETRRRYSKAVLPPLADRIRPRDHRPSPSGKLRVGYVSAFFPDRNWMKPMWGAINHHDRRSLEVHLFSDAPAGGPFPGYEPGAGDTVHETKGLDNASFAALVRREGIDVLVDLNGYSCVPRLGLYPYRSAPVQVAWAGMYATSGQDSFDALATDGVVVPEGDEPFFSEPIRRLPGTHLAFDVRYPVPPVAPPPARASGRVTFGCLAPLYKLHPFTLEAFAEVLARTPGSRLLLRNRGLDAPGVRSWLTHRLSVLGIATDRLVLLGGAEHFTFLETYGQVDVALDSFPYNGGTSTMESLWQGVPLVTFRGRRLIERQSTTLLLAAGRADLVARDRDGFVDLACRLAAEARGEESYERRMTAREVLPGTEACDTPRLSRGLEGIYRDLFAAWEAAG